MFSVLIFLLVLSVLVLGHELGHYIAARLCGVKAEEFGYGFPPRAIGFVKVNGKWKRVGARDQSKYKNTIWSLNWLPLGGFVRLKGEQGEDGGDPESFLSKKIPQRLFILAAGVMMNWFIAAAIFSGGFAIGVPAETDGLPRGAIVSDQKIQITDVLAHSAAETVGLQPGDTLLSINGTPVTHSDMAREMLSKQATTVGRFVLVVERREQKLTLTAVPTYIEELKHPGLGVALADTGTVRFPWYQAIAEGTLVTLVYTKMIFVGLWQVIRDLFTKRELVAQLSGPVGIAVLTGQIASNGAWPLLQFAALLSINLAIVNFLPIPALDGGRALFVFIEALRRQRANPKFEAIIHQVGFVLLLILVALVTVHDVRQYGGMIWQGIKHAAGF